MRGNQQQRRQTVLTSVMRGTYGAICQVGITWEPLVILSTRVCLGVAVVLELFSLTFPAGTHFPHGLMLGIALFGLVGHPFYLFVLRRFARLAEGASS
jgi:hypothetical protein